MNTPKEKWLAITEEIRDKLLRNVWCTKCRDAVEVVDYVIKGHDLGIMLEGKCGKCGHSVARVIEKED